MSDQADLFKPLLKPAETRSRRSDPLTSRQAARAAEGKFSELQRDVLRLHKRFPQGLTDLDLQALTGSGLSTYRTRRKELVEAGYLFDSGQRKAQEGSNRIIWMLTEMGKNAVI